MPAFVISVYYCIITNITIEAYLMIITLLANHICELFITIFIVKVNNDFITIITIICTYPRPVIVFSVEQNKERQMQ